MGAKKTSISIDERLYNDAHGRFSSYYANSFSEYVAELIKQDLIKQRTKAAEEAEPSLLIDPPGIYAKGSQVVHQHKSKGDIKQKKG
jgi:hypothetical protein